MPEKSALFVCLGNICRSPIAEACFKELLLENKLSKHVITTQGTDDAGTILINAMEETIGGDCFHHNVRIQWMVDSAATSNYQIGNPPDHRGQSCMKSHDIYHHVKKHRARQVVQRDFDMFDYILGMDQQNMRDLEDKAPNRPYKAKLLMLGLFDDNKDTDGVVRDPYFSRDASDFEAVYNQCMRCCRNFLRQLMTAT